MPLRPTPPGAARAPALAASLTAAALLVGLAPGLAPGRRAGAQTPAPTAGGPVRVFLDCPPARDACDRDFFVAELPFVAWTRDRLDADAHLLVAAIATGAGGVEWTVTAIGQRAFRGLADTTVVTTLPNDADLVARERLARAMRVSLLPFLKRGGLLPRLDVTVADDEDAGAAGARGLRDRWRLWVFETRLEGEVTGEQRQHLLDGTLGVGARRVGEVWKVVLGADVSRRDSRFTLDGGRRERFVVRAERADARVVHALGGSRGRWSAGVVATAGSSDFLNQRVFATVKPAAEWNRYPWAEATRRQLTVSYAAGASRFDYFERTVFGRTAETRPSHQLTAAWSAVQPWGTTNVAARAAQFLHDPSRTNVALRAEADLRFGRGLSLEVWSQAAHVRDQLFLPAADLPPEEQIARTRALATSFQYSLWVGVRYQFGSVYNTIVNQRLDAFHLGGRFFQQ